jgi:phosphatidylserine/phosphatidylglycerophosphate/cardiolipin synthase-like enzyme
VSVRVIGKLTQTIAGLAATKGPRLRLHVRAIVRDRKGLFIGSQSLRRPQIDGRREIGLIVNETKIAASVARVFEQDWEDSTPKSTPAAEPELVEAS